MTIKELIAELQKHDESIDVAFSWDQGLSIPRDGELEEHFGKQVLVFNVSDYDSWGWQNSPAVEAQCICAGYDGDSHRGTCPKFGTPR